MIKLMGSLFSFSEILFLRHKRIMKKLINTKQCVTADDVFELEKDKKKWKGADVFREFHITSVFAVLFLECFIKMPVESKLPEETTKIFMEVMYPIQPKFLNRAQLFAIKQLPTLEVFISKIYPKMKEDSDERNKLGLAEMSEAAVVLRRVTLITEQIMLKYGFKDKITILKEASH